MSYNFLVHPQNNSPTTLNLVLSLILAIVLLENFGNLLLRIRELRPSEVAYEERMTIDGRTYAELGRAAAANRQFFTLQSGKHSGAMQVLMAQWFYWMPAKSAVLNFKYFNAALWLLSVFLVGYAAYALTGTYFWGGFAAALLSYSNLFATYTAILSIEPILTAIGAALTLLICQRPTLRKRAAVGLCLFALCAFRVSYLVPAVIFILWDFVRSIQKRELPTFTALFLSFGISSLIWSLLISFNNFSYFFFPLSSHTFKSYVNPNALAPAFPVPNPIPPYGLEFVRTHPVQYLRLVASKIPYFLGIEPDIWFVESKLTLVTREVTNWSLPQSRLVASLIGFAVATMGFAAGLIKAKAPFFTLCLFFAIGFLPFIFIFGASTRFIVPMLPFLIVCQTWALFQLTQFLNAQITKLYLQRGSNAATSH